MRFRFRALASALIFSCLLVSLTSSCVLYRRTDPIIKVPDFYESKAFVDGLYLIVDPYVTSARTEYLFDTDLPEKGIYTVHLILQNWGENRFDFSDSRMVLMDRDGERFEPMIREEVERKVLKKPSGHFAGLGALEVFVMVLNVPLAGLESFDSYVPKSEMKDDIRSKEFQRRPFEPKKVRQGFLFFQLPGKKKELAGRLAKEYTLRIEKIQNLTTEEFFDAEIPIKKSV